MFMIDFDNFNKKCKGWKRFYLIADDISKWFSFNIFPYAFSLWENRFCLSAFDIRKKMHESVAQR